jgi:hypothetical protein
MEQTSARFIEKVSYRSRESFKKEVTVRLHIDYIQKTFSVKPYISTNDKFTFDACRDVEKWKAICEAIKNAVEFADRELNGPKEQPYQYV